MYAAYELWYLFMRWVGICLRIHRHCVLIYVVDTIVSHQFCCYGCLHSDAQQFLVHIACFFLLPCRHSSCHLLSNLICKLIGQSLYFAIVFILLLLRKSLLFQGDLIGVIGKVGSGKSSLLAAITAEMERLHGEVRSFLWLLGVIHLLRSAIDQTLLPCLVTIRSIAFHVT